MFAAMHRGSHEQITRVHRVPALPDERGRYGHSDYHPALCGVTAEHRMWAPVGTAPPVDAAPPLAHRCPGCFDQKETA